MARLDELLYAKPAETGCALYILAALYVQYSTPPTSADYSNMFLHL